MSKKRTPTERRHVREKAVIDHLVEKMTVPETKAEPSNQSPTTSTGLPVEDQVRKRWDPGKGGLPILSQ